MSGAAKERDIALRKLFRSISSRSPHSRGDSRSPVHAWRAHRDQELRMSMQQPLDVLGLLEPLSSELPDRLEHPVALSVKRTRLFSSRDSDVEVGVQTSSAASSVQPPAKTDRRAKSCCSSAESRP